MLTGGELSRQLFAVGSFSFGDFKSIYSKCYANMQQQYTLINTTAVDIPKCNLTATMFVPLYTNVISC
jgi:hypothetical protein